MEIGGASDGFKLLAAKRLLRVASGSRLSTWQVTLARLSASCPPQMLDLQIFPANGPKSQVFFEVSQPANDHTMA